MTEQEQNNGVYRISRVIGNNFVCTVDDGGTEIILRGLGIGFTKHAGDWFRCSRWRRFMICAIPRIVPAARFAGRCIAEFLESAQRSLRQQSNGSGGG